MCHLRMHIDWFLSHVYPKQHTVPFNLHYTLYVLKHLNIIIGNGTEYFIRILIKEGQTPATKLPTLDKSSYVQLQKCIAISLKHSQSPRNLSFFSFSCYHRPRVDQSDFA